MTSPEYIRGQRDGMEGAISTVKLALEDCQWEPVCPHADACIGALTVEAAKLTEADGIDWRAAMTSDEAVEAVLDELRRRDWVDAAGAQTDTLRDDARAALQAAAKAIGGEKP